MDNFENTISKLVYEKYNSLPKNGKPKPNEWTVLSAIVQDDTNDLEIVSLCTGCKCVGRSEIVPDGSRVNDSHAEILARRCFLKYLYYQLSIAKSSENNNSIFYQKSLSTCRLKYGIKFHLFISELPCGDAVIFPKDECNHTADIYRTGAKCVPSCGIEDLKLPGIQYHTVGALRTKPGRGDPTISMSCSDKILKWNYMGIQGALLNILINEPIYLDSLVVAGGIPFSKHALERALNRRFDHMLFDNDNDNRHFFSKNDLKIYQSSYKCEFWPGKSNNVCSTSICWTKTLNGSIDIEVLVDGRRHGITKKNLTKNYAHVSISKKQLFEQFKTIVKNDVQFNSLGLTSMTYTDAKNLSKSYNEVWTFVKNVIFQWPQKDVKLFDF